MSDDQSRNPGLPARDGSTDPWLWLEDVTGDDALEWVREHNARAEQELDADGEATTLAAELKTILDSPASIPNVVRRGDIYAITCGEPMGTPGGTNMLKISRVG